jgi:hypothetical protein
MPSDLHFKPAFLPADNESGKLVSFLDSQFSILTGMTVRDWRTEPSANRMGHFLNPWISSKREDLFALAGLTACICIVMGFVWHYDFWLTDYDKLSQFIPWFGHIGDRLSSGELPLWNPNQGAGQPLIGAPASGWLSIPIAVCFAFVDVITGYKLFVLIHLVMAGFGTYAFCRVLGMFPFPAVVAGTSYALGAVLHAAIRWEAASGQILMFVPIAMLSVEMAIRSKRLSAMLGWSSLAGLIVCQMYVSSIPRVIYPVLLMAGWMAWRLVSAPSEEVENRFHFLRKLIVIGITISVVFLGTASAALLPQLEYNSQTNVSGADYDVPAGDYASATFPYDYMLYTLFGDEQTISKTRASGGAVVALALLAVFGWRYRFGVPLFGFATLAYIDFTLRDSLVRPLLWLIPGTEALTGHRPISAGAITAFTMSILAGAGAQWLSENRMQRSTLWMRLAPAPIIAFALFALDRRGFSINVWSITAAYLALVAAIFWLNASGSGSVRRNWWHHVVPRMVLISAILLVPTIKDITDALRQPENRDFYTHSLSRIESERDAVDRIVAVSDPGTAAGFLQEQTANTQPVRIASWSGFDYEKFVFEHQTERTTVGLVTNGRPIALDLQQVYSYNPTQIDSFVDYLEVMNGRPQDYHFTEILGRSLGRSQLLDMLNVEYVLVPTLLDPLPNIAQWGTVVYEDELIRIYENPHAFPRAWIVHDVREEMDGEELFMINSWRVNGREVAFVDGELPSVSPLAADAAADSVFVTKYLPEEISLRASTSADGFLVFSELFVDGWNAYVDGEKVNVVRTNHALRGVAIGAGDHTVVLKYEPRSVTIGLAVTGVTSLAMIGVWIWAGIDRRRTYSKEIPAGT